jgi:hypothetical protein
LRNLKKASDDATESGDYRGQGKAKDTSLASSGEIRDASPAGVAPRSKKCSIRIPGPAPYHSDSPREPARGGAQSVQDLPRPGRGSSSVDADDKDSSAKDRGVFPPLNGRRQR